MTPRPNRAWMAALCVVVGCTASDPPSQVLTGRVDAKQGAVAIRAVVGGEVATAAEVRSDGAFTLALPAGERYRLEVLTRSGVKHLVTRSGTHLVGVSFKVCAPADPFSFGTVGDPNTNGMCTDPSDPDCKPEPTPCDPMDQSCQPPSCQLGDPSCPCDPATGVNCPPPPCMDPTDPNCNPPPPCDPADPMCGCMADGTCCQPGEPNCPPPPPPCDPTTEPNCKPDPCTDPTAPGCAPPCTDPMDPGTCGDPCPDDPMSCGCMANDPNCWGQPPKCDDAGCAPGDSMMPEHAPSDFGCEGSGAS